MLLKNNIRRILKLEKLWKGRSGKKTHYSQKIILRTRVWNVKCPQKTSAERLACQVGKKSNILDTVIKVLPDQMFHILAQACLTEKQFKFGFNRKSNCFCVVFDSLQLRSTLFDFLKQWLTHFSGHKKCETFGRVETRRKNYGNMDLHS